MNIPDYVSPIVAYRTWQWDNLGLRSLNEEQWFPRQPLAASCRASQPGCHQPPCLTCTCGVYAAKNFDHLQAIGYARYGIHGETYLWGTVVEHRLGYRAQFAYPKTLVLPLDTIPFKIAEAESRLQTLLSYGVDLFLSKEEGTVLLWSKESGFNAVGFEYLIEVRKKYYEDYLQERTLRQGDRVALLGKGIALVALADDRDVRLTLWNRVTLKLCRRDIVWNQGNMRWEAAPETTVEMQSASPLSQAAI
jgi:hypothetical protein